MGIVNYEILNIDTRFWEVQALDIEAGCSLYLCLYVGVRCILKIARTYGCKIKTMTGCR